MPIAAAFPIMKNQLETAWSQDKVAKVQTCSSMFAQAVASGAVLGMIPGTPPMPVVPLGMGATTQMLNTAASMDKIATVDLTSQLTATAISLLAPMVPPVGVSVLGQMIKTANSMSKVAKVSTVATLYSQAIVNYYMSGGVV